MFAWVSTYTSLAMVIPQYNSVQKPIFLCDVGATEHTRKRNPLVSHEAN